MTTRDALQKFFGPSAAGITVADGILTGYASVNGAEVCVLGTADGTYINNAAALRLAAQVLDCVENHAGAPIVMIVDSAGQEPNRTAEMLGLAGYFAHLLACLEVARDAGHKLVTVATGKAIGGAFICYGMSADAIYALDSASVGLMPVEAMSAVTKIPVETLTALSKTMPALEFGAVPFSQLGGVVEVWPSAGPLADNLAAAIAAASPEDKRAALGKERGGRRMALDVRDRVLAESARGANSQGARPSRPCRFVITAETAVLPAQGKSMSVQGHPLKLPSIKPLRRHTLVWLASPPRTDAVADQPAADAWHARGLPFVVTRQPAAQPGFGVGFCLPEANRRPRRVAARCGEESVLRVEPPPLLESVAGECAEAAAAAAALADLASRIFGSWMWRFLEGGPHTRPGSDLDLLVAVSGRAEAERAVLALQAAEAVSALRLDGELSFPCGEVSWREYAGRPPQILLKSVTDVRLVPFAELP